MHSRLTRREFLKLSGTAITGIPFLDHLPEEDRPLPALGHGRVTQDAIRVRSTPSFKGEIVGWRNRDEILTLLEEIISPEGPVYNRKWYRLLDGYIHSAYVQRVAYRFNRPHKDVPTTGSLAEITVPYSQSLRFYRTNGWRKLYRLYYQSLHWVTGIVEGPDGDAWYEITDDLHRQKYSIPSDHARILSPDEYSPLSPDVPPEEKWIDVSLADQKVTCFEGDSPVFSTLVSAGVGGPTNNDIPRETPAGRFRISWKMPVRHMGNGELTDDYLAYELPGTPWCSFFVSTGVAFHGAYWHDNFGSPMSSGCVNMRPDDAKWLYRWTMPTLSPDQWFKDESGTVVVVRAPEISE